MCARALAVTFPTWDRMCERVGRDVFSSRYSIDVLLPGLRDNCEPSSSICSQIMETRENNTMDYPPLPTSTLSPSDANSIIPSTVLNMSGTSSGKPGKKSARKRNKSEQEETFQTNKKDSKGTTNAKQVKQQKRKPRVKKVKPCGNLMELKKKRSYKRTGLVKSSCEIEKGELPEGQGTNVACMTNRSVMFETFQPWVVKTYGDSAKTKTITKKKYTRILRTLTGEEMNNAENSKFRFWVKAKGFRIGPLANHEHHEDNNGPMESSSQRLSDEPYLYVPVSAKVSARFNPYTYACVLLEETHDIHSILISQ